MLLGTPVYSQMQSSTTVFVKSTFKMLMHIMLLKIKLKFKH